MKLINEEPPQQPSAVSEMIEIVTRGLQSGEYEWREISGVEVEYLLLSVYWDVADNETCTWPRGGMLPPARGPRAEIAWINIAVSSYNVN